MTMLQTLISQGIESAFNTWLSLDAKTYGTARSHLTSLQGKLICLKLREPSITLYFLPTNQAVTVSTHYDAEPDVTIHGSVLALLRVMRSTDAGQAMLANQVRVDGDSGLGMRFSEILREVDIDWEELLSRAVGDSLAHQVGKQVRQTQHWLTDSANAMRLNLQEYLQEETRITLPDAELRPFLEAVDQIRMAVDRLEARIRLLEKPSSVNT